MVKNEVLVKVENVSKKFSKDLKTSLKYGLLDITKNTLGFKGGGSKLRRGEFWAVRDVSFELKRGECIGLIGHNGAGKSTLLKMLNGLYAPDTGKITMKGKIGALIELGAGFNPILSGRENIYNNAAILGFTREEVDSKMKDIISFSEIEKFLDMPVKNYSSGMKVRLGFAIAAHMQPDILIVDEVLAVGDLGFVLKCFKKIDELLPNTALIFVSHSMPMISRLCNEVILMDKGHAQFQGNDVGKGIDLYYQKFSNNHSNTVFDNKTLEIKSCFINNSNRPILNWGSTLEIELEIAKISEIDSAYIYLTIMDKEQRPVAQLKSKELDIRNKTDFKVNFIHENLQLSKGSYSLNLKIDRMLNNTPILRINQILSFQVIDNEEIWTSFLLDTKILLQ